MGQFFPLPSSPKGHLGSCTQLELVEISETNKTDLLQKSAQACKEGLPQTEHMLANLRNLEPSKASKFELKSTAISKAPLRLLKQPTAQQHDSVPRIESYIALSYCWHGSEWQVAESLGQLEMGWPITTDMIYKVLSKRVTSEEGIWIDQLCINQSDELEKRHAIGSMDILYKSARSTIVVLEDIKLSLKEDSAVTGILDDEGPEDIDLDALSRALIRILSARWFKRAWCSHELQLSNNVLILVPGISKIIELSLDDVEYIYSKTSDHCLQSDELSGLFTSIYMSYEFLTRNIFRHEGYGLGRSLISEFSDIQQLSCYSQTDVLSIAVNISGLNIFFKDTIVSANECRWMLAMIALAAGDATVLGGVEEPINIGDNFDKPSWLNWVEEAEDTMIHVGASRLSSPAYIRSTDQQKITLDFYDLTKCDVKGPSTANSMRALGLVSSIAQVLENEALEFQPYWMQSISESNKKYGEGIFVAGLLACSFECGLDWMITQISLVDNLATRIDMLLPEGKSEFWHVIESVLHELYGASWRDHLDDEQKNSLRQYFWIIIYDSPLGEGILRLGSLRPQPFSDPEGEKNLYKCRWLDLGSGNKALVAIRPSQIGKDRLVVPVALSNGSCAYVRRLWLLQEGYGPESDTWKLIEKFYIFTFQDVVESKTVVRRSYQSIRQWP